MAGAAPAVACGAVVKWILAPSIEVAAANPDAAAINDSGGMLANALDFSRYSEVARGNWEPVANLGSWWFHPLLLLLLRSPEDWAREAPERTSRKQRKHETAKMKRSRAT